MFGYKLVKEEYLDYLQKKLELTEKLADNWENECKAIISDYARCQSELTKLNTCFKCLQQELEQTKREKEEIEQQFNDYLIAESLMR